MDASDDFKRTTLRLPQRLYDRVEAAAERHGRSFNSEVIDALEEKFPPSPEDFDFKMREAMAEAGITSPHDPRFFEVIMPLMLEISARKKPHKK